MQTLKTLLSFAELLNNQRPGTVGHFFSGEPLEVGPAKVEGLELVINILECAPRPQNTFYIAYEIPAEKPIPFATGLEAGAAVFALIKKLRASDIYIKRSDSSRHVAIAITSLEEAWLRLTFAAPGGMDSTGKEVKP